LKKRAGEVKGETMSLSDITASFQPVTTKNASLFNDYYKIFFKSHKYPRFYQSVLEISQYVNVPLYFSGIIDECLVIVHKRHIHLPVFYLPIPPISKNSDHTKEGNIIELFQKYGCHTRLSEEEMKVLGISETDVNKNKYNSEFIYSANELKTMPGKKWQNIRYKVNKFHSLIKDEKLETKLLQTMDFLTHEKCKRIYEIWLKQKEKKSIHSAHKVLLNCPKSMRNLISLIYNKETNALIAWGASECISDGKIIQTTRFRNYDDNTLVDPTTIIHYLECIYWADIFGEETLCNFGSGVFPDLIEHKYRLKPIATLQMYDLKTEKGIQKSDWDDTCISWKKRKGFNLGY